MPQKKRPLLWIESGGCYYPFHLLNRKAQLLSVVGEWQQVEDLFRNMLVKAEAYSDRGLAATVKNQMGFLYTRSGRNQEALSLLEEAYRYDEETGDTSQMCRPLVNMGNAYKNLGDYDNARFYYKKAIETAEACGDWTTVGMVHSNLALLHWQQGENEQAMEDLKIAMAEAEGNGDLQQVGITLGTMGNIHFSYDRLEEALACYRRMLGFAQIVGDKLTLRVALNNIGAIHDRRGEYREEMECFQQSLEIAREMGNKAGERLVLGNLGIVSMNYGDLKIAGDYLKRSLALAQELGERRGVGIARFNLGLLAALKGDYQAASDEYDRALPILDELKVSDFLSTCLLRMAEVGLRLGRLLEAREWARRAINIAEEAGHKEEAGLSKVVREEIEHRIGLASSESAGQRLQQIFENCGEKLVQAEAMAALYRLAGSEEYRKRAWSLFKEIVSMTPRFELLKKMKELEG